MKNTLYPNNFFLLAVGGLIFFGLLMLSTASAVLSFYNRGNDYYYLKQQLINGLIPGLVLFFAAGYFPYRKLKKFAMPLMLFSMFLLALLFVPGLGVSIKGATRWLDFKIISFQPSEVLKLAVVIYLAALFESRKKDSVAAKEKLLPFIVISAVMAALLILQPDLGTLGVVLGIAFIMYFAAGAKIAHLLAAALIGLAVLAAFILISGHGLDRIQVFLNPGSDKLEDASYQVNQAAAVIASGGYFGLGFGASQTKIGLRLPEPMGDSIFAIIAQELGFSGVLAVIILLVTFGWYGFKIAKFSRDAFGSLLTTGVVVWILAQSFINIGAISGFLPLTGIPLPFVSYGGTSLTILLTACGIVYNIQKTSL